MWVATVAAVLLWSSFVCDAKPSKFVSWTRDVRNSSVITVDTDELHQIDVGWPPLTRLEIVGVHNVSINFTCFVNPLQEDDNIIRAKFCFGTTRDGFKGNCFDLRDPNVPRTVDVGDGRNIPVTLSFDRHRGSHAVLQEIPSSMSLNEIKFCCRVGNRQGWEDSNDVEIFDYRQQFPQVAVTFDIPKSALDPERRQCFNCLPEELKNGPKAVVNYVWKFCSDTSLKDCENVLDIREPSWSVQLLSNGSLCWSYVPRQVVPILEGKRLKCSVGDQDIALYRQPITFKHATRNGENEFKLIYPESTPKNITVLSGDPGRFFLPLKTDGGSSVTLRWRQGPRSLRHLREGESPHGKCYLEQVSNIPVCHGPFTDDVAPVEVEKEPDISRFKRWPVAEKILEYNIQRVGLGPELSEQMPDTVFMMDGSNASIICRFKEPEKVISMLSVRGYFLNFNSQEALKLDIQTVNLMYEKVMSQLRASVNVNRPTYGQLVEYKLVNVVYRDHNNLSSDHYIACHGYREKKWVRRQIMLKVLPRPQIIGITNRTVNDGTLAFHIDVKNEDEIRKLGAELTVDWKLDGVPVNKSSLSSEFEVVVKPGRSHKNLSCVVHLENPTVSNGHESRIVFQSAPMTVTLPLSDMGEENTAAAVNGISTNVWISVLVCGIATRS